MMSFLESEAITTWFAVTLVRKDLVRTNFGLRLAIRLAPKENVGIIYEVRFEQVLEKLAQEVLVSFWRKTYKNSKDDQFGVDYYVHDKISEIPFAIAGRKKSGADPERKREREKQIAARIQVVNLRPLRGPGMKSVNQVKDEVIEKIQSYRQ